MRPMSYLVRARSPRLRILLAVVAAALFLQACAQDAATDSTEGSSAAAEQESGAPAATGSEAPAGTDGAAAQEGDEQAGAEGEVAGVDLSADFCAITDQLDKSDMFDKEPESAEEFAATAEQIKQVYAALSDKAPQEIADDVELVTRIGGEQIDLATRLTADAQGDPTKVLEDPDVAEQMQQFSSDSKFTKASRRLDKWTDTNC